MRHSIPQVKSSHLHPFLSTFNHIGVSTERSLIHVGLNPDKVLEGEVFIPEYAAWHLLDYVSQSQGIDNLGSYISEGYSVDRYGAFGEHLASAPCLYTALQRLIHDLKDHANYQNYWLQEKGEYIELCRIGTPGIDVGKHQIEQHIMVFFIELIRSYLGDNWLPDYLHVQSRSKRGVTSSPTLDALDITYDKAYGVIPIPKHSLLQQATIEEKISVAHLPHSPGYFPTIDRQLYKLLKQDTFHSYNDLQSVTRALGVSKRQLQRELSALGTSFRDITNEVLQIRAISMLNEYERPVQSIARDLGYSNPKNFTRAFKALTGLSPSEYRQLNGDLDMSNSPSPNTSIDGINSINPNNELNVSNGS